MNITDDVLGQTPYTRLLPLGYMVPTFYPTPSGTVQARSGAPQVTLQDPDLQARAQRLLNVLYWTADACKDQQGMDDASTLKVFIAPEFYFRKASADEVSGGGFSRSTSFGAYPERARQELAEALYGAIHDSPLFKDWVIVAGTLCSALPFDLSGRMNLLNTAIMLRGQRAQPDASVPYIFMEKHYISNIDGPDGRDHANLDPTTTYSFRLNPDQHLDNLVYWDGMSVGLEVCLDHSEQVVANAMNLLRQTLGPRAASLELQLVTSCGMSIVQQAVAVADGALVMLVDGYSHVDSGLREPIFQMGRHDAATGSTHAVPATSFQLKALPDGADYRVTYAGGLYTGRQGVWTSTQPLALNATKTQATSAAVSP